MLRDKIKALEARIMDMIHNNFEQQTAERKL